MNKPAERKVDRKVVADRRREQRLGRVVEAKVATTVDNDADARDDKATVETGDTISGNGLAVHIDLRAFLWGKNQEMDINVAQMNYQTVELTFATTLALGVVGKTSTSIVERVDKEERGGTGETT